MHISIRYHWESLFEMEQKQTQNGPWSSWAFYKLAYEARKLQQIATFEDLITLNSPLPITFMPHQIETARRVMHEMHGRAILGDEVGLGKTIEAGLLLKEYIIRGLVGKTLILVPASLVLQWVRELHEKFAIEAVAHKKDYVWANENIVVASIEAAKKPANAAIIFEQKYDMVIVDEAHKLKNPRTKNYQFVNAIQKKFCLLLTATPLQNDQKELYHLLQLLKPGVLQKQDSHSPDVLKRTTNQLMVRNRRQDQHEQTVRRIIHNHSVQLSPEELDLYESVHAYIYTHAQSTPHKALSLMTLQREVCSSRDAVFVTLVNLFKKLPEHAPERAQIWQLVEKIRAIHSNSKAEQALKIIQSVPDKVIVFTEYRATQQYLLHFLALHNIDAIPYQGGMGRGKKDWMTDLFRNRAKVLIATEAGGEGINLQFCNQLINFDLPWNPMRIEQRIGRVHRFGQQRDVHIYNLVTEKTIEQHVLTLLQAKIDLFQTVIGALDPILLRTEEAIHTSVLAQFTSKFANAE